MRYAFLYVEGFMVHEMMFGVQEYISYIQWLEKKYLLTANSGNQLSGTNGDILL